MTPRLKLIQDICAQNMVIYQNKYKQYYDKDINPARFVVGSKVLLHNPGAVRVGDRPKLSRMWVGPYIVTEIFDERNVRLFDPVKLKEMKPRVHVNRLRPYNNDRDVFYQTSYNTGRRYSRHR